MADTATIAKWGNSQGIRLPKAFCDQLHLSVGDKVSLALENDKITITATEEEQHTLKARMKNWNGERLISTEINWHMQIGEEALRPILICLSSFFSPDGGVVSF